MKRATSKQSVFALAALAASAGLVGCNDPTTFAPTSTDQFVYDSEDRYSQASKLLQADYLIVPDLSYSFTPAKRDLEAALENFAEHLADEKQDFRIAFARGTTQSVAPGGKQFKTNGEISKYIPSSFMGSVILPTSKNGVRSQVADKLLAIAGPNSPNLNLILETALKTLDSKQGSFLRDAAQLVFVFISDSDDESHIWVNSNRSPSYYSNALREFKSNDDYINARAFVTNSTLSCDPLGAEYLGYKNGTRLTQVANAVDSLGDGFQCLRDGEYLSNSLENLARDVSKPTRRFKIQSPVKPSTIEVRVAGKKVNPGPSTWTYKPSTNEIVFTDAAKPKESDSVEITFEMLIKLNRSPIVSTMSVTLNGQSVPQSNGNGWSFNSNTGELSFNGGFKPQHNDRISVSYEVQ